MDEIDVLFQGVPRSVCCHRVGGVIVDPGPESSSSTLLEALDGWVPRAILLTHIHLDHAGATGALLRDWPETEVWVHERGARHLVDPSRLIASATRIYGDDMDRLWGEIVPVPKERLRVLRGGERVEGFRVAYTPGHAVHHVSYLHEESGTAFCGDVAGVRVGEGPVFPPTPPPDIDVEAWLASIDIVQAWSPWCLAVTHFGSFGDVQVHLDELRSALRRWAELAREVDEAGYVKAVREHLDRLPQDLRASYLEAMPPQTLYGGLARYWEQKGRVA
jgi:glyoxylase-like metal-dependent hydrolase (beta-lactamase superfamily II)